MAWCLMAPSHELNQYWPSSVTPYCITRPQCIYQCWPNSLMWICFSMPHWVNTFEVRGKHFKIKPPKKKKKKTRKELMYGSYYFCLNFLFRLPRSRRHGWTRGHQTAQLRRQGASSRRRWWSHRIGTESSEYSDQQQVILYDTRCGAWDPAAVAAHFYGIVCLETAETRSACKWVIME